MHEPTARRGLAHRRRSFPHPLIAEVIAAVALLATPMQPTVVAAAAQDDGFKLLHSRSTKERKLQVRRAILLLEEQAKRMFRALLGPAVPAALDAEATVNLEPRLAVRENHFRRRRPLPIAPRLHRMRVNAARGIEQIVQFRNGYQTYALYRCH